MVCCCAAAAPPFVAGLQDVPRALLGALMSGADWLLGPAPSQLPSDDGGIEPTSLQELQADADFQGEDSDASQPKTKGKRQLKGRFR